MGSSKITYAFLAIFLIFSQFLSVLNVTAQHSTLGVTPVNADNVYEKTHFYKESDLGIAGGFHLVGFGIVEKKSHIHGNILTKELKYDGGDFGTREVDEVSYAQTISNSPGMKAGVTKNSVLVVGKDVEIGTADNGNAWSIRGGKVDKPSKSENPNGLWQDNEAEFIDFDQLWNEVLDIQNRWSQYEDNGVEIIGQNIDRNNQKITISDSSYYNVYNVQENDFAYDAPIHIYGFEPSKISTLIINVDMAKIGRTSFNIPNSVINFKNGEKVSTGEVQVWSNANVVWNIFDSSKADKIFKGEVSNGGAVTGSIIAPGATVKLSSNINGTVIAEHIIVEAESHRDDYVQPYQTPPAGLEPIIGEVIVKHVDEEGNELVESSTLTGEVGDSYTTNPEDIDGFELIETPSNAEGKFTEEDQTVIYIYKKIPEPQVCEVFTLIVVDEAGELVTEGTYYFSTEENSEKLEGTVSEEGTITFSTNELPAGEYIVTDTDGNKVGEITVSYDENAEDCGVELVIESSSKPQVCEEFTIEVVNESGEAITSIVVKDESGNEVASSNSSTITLSKENVPAGNYTVEVTIEDGRTVTEEVNVVYEEDCGEATVITVPAEDTEDPQVCEEFTIEAEDELGKAITSIVVKDGTGNEVANSNKNTIILTKENISAGNYAVEVTTEDGRTVTEEVEVVYEENCGETTVITVPAENAENPQTCETFTITVIDENGNLITDGNYIFTSKNSEVEIGTYILEDGIITFSSNLLPAGEYIVTDSDGNVIGEITVSYDENAEDCGVELVIESSSKPQVCEEFTIETVDELEKEITSIVVKDGEGKEVASSNSSTITLSKENVPAGNYTVEVTIEDGRTVTEEVNVVYEEDCGEATVITVPAEDTEDPQVCEEFTIEAEDELGKTITSIVVKDGSGKEVASSNNNTITLSKENIPAGNYAVEVTTEDGRTVSEEVEVIYEENCGETTVITVPAGDTEGPQVCEVFTITVVDEAGELVTEGTYYFSTEENGEKLEGTVSEEGTITFSTNELPAGEYIVTDSDGNVIGEITVSYDENAEDCGVDLVIVLPPEPQVCEEFTIETVDELEKEITSIVVKDGEGKEVASSNNNTITLSKENVPAGNYTVEVTTEDGRTVSEEVEVIYEENCGEKTVITVQAGDTEEPQVCEEFTIEAEDELGKAITSIVVKDESGKEVASSNSNTITLSKENVPAGNYTVEVSTEDGRTVTEEVEVVYGEVCDEATVITVPVSEDPGEKNPTEDPEEPTEKPTPVNEGTVITKYVDENGNEIAKQNETTDKVGNDYDTTKKNIPGYEYVKVDGNSKGTYEEGKVTVTYIYKLIQEEPPVFEEGPVITKYVDEDGNEIAKQNEVTNKVGKGYQTTQKNIPGYELVQVEGNSTGSHQKTPTTVIYVFEKVVEDPPVFEEGKVTTKYIDEAGNEIANSSIQTDGVGTSYKTDLKEIEGYELVEMPSNSTGVFNETDQTVTYVYKKIVTAPPVYHEGTVITKYVDENGNELAGTSKQTNELGANYTTNSKEIDGYELVEVPNNATGVFNETDQIVTYVYKKVTTEDDNEIDEPGETDENEDESSKEDSYEDGSTDEESSEGPTDGESTENESDENEATEEEFTGEETDGTSVEENDNGKAQKDNEYSESLSSNIAKKENSSSETIDSSAKTKNTLPKTSTNNYNILGLGLFLLFAGLFIGRRKAAN